MQVYVELFSGGAAVLTSFVNVQNFPPLLDFFKILQLLASFYSKLIWLVWILVEKNMMCLKFVWLATQQHGNWIFLQIMVSLQIS